MESPRPTALLAAGLLPAILLAAPRTGGFATLDLTPGSPLEVVHRVDEEPPAIRVVVPPTATFLRVYTEGASHDVGLVARFDSPPDFERGEWGVRSPDDWIDEELLIDVTDSYCLEPGEWYFRLPVVSDALRPDAVDRVTYTIHAELVEPRPEPLRLGEPREVRVHKRGGLRAAFRVEQGEDGPRGPLRFEVYSPDVDVDLLAGPDDAARILTEPYAIGATTLNYERLVLDPSVARDGIVLHAYAWPELEGAETATVRVLAIRDAPGQRTLLPRPEIPTEVPGDPLARAVAATVLVFGPTNSGSGVVVSPQGHFLTNAHVVSGAEAYSTPSGLAAVGVGFTVDPRRAPTPTVGARLLDYREDLDLALLQIAGTLDGAPLPEGTRFPWIELSAEEPVLGAPLTCVGYPDTGGLGSFVTITATRGIFSGFAREAEGVVYKTDAGIHSGVSGGACLDERGRLVGVPHSSVGYVNGVDRLGYVIPVGLIPPAWREASGL